jgi:dTDP-4-dehydrorhamnose 3,5-epimerase
MDGVTLTPLKKIHHPKGDLFHAMKNDDIGYSGFGEAYFSTINQFDIKGWKKHTKMTLNLVVPIGEIRIVVCNEITNAFYSVDISHDNYQRVTIKPGLWVAFKGISEYNMLLNIASIAHNPSEAKNIAIDEINYAW